MPHFCNTQHSKRASTPGTLLPQTPYQEFAPGLPRVSENIMKTFRPPPLCECYSRSSYVFTMFASAAVKRRARGRRGTNCVDLRVKPSITQSNGRGQTDRHATSPRRKTPT